MLPYLEKSFFANVIKDFEMKRSSQIIWLSPKSDDLCPYKRYTEVIRQKRWRETQKEKFMWRWGKDGGDVAKSQGMPSATRTWKKQGRILLWSLQREWGPVDILISAFWPPENCERISLHCYKPLNVWLLVTIILEMIAPTPLVFFLYIHYSSIMCVCWGG